MKKARVTVLISDKIDFKTNCNKDKERQYVMTREQSNKRI